MKSYSIKTISTLLLMMGLFVSCNDTNSTNPDEIKPTLPPTQSMTIDLSEFDNSNGKAKSESNFNAAVFRAGVAKLIIDANLAIPKTLIGAAQNANSETVAEGEYQWRYNADNGEDDFSVLLTAQVDSEDEVEWNFFVTTSATNPPLNNFLLFSGESEFDGTEGEWRYFDAQESEAVSEIEWDIDNDGSIELSFLVLSDRNGNEGASIDYEFNGTTKSLVYVDGSNGDTTTIEFNTETKAGFIISPNYNEGVKACWDETFADVACE